MAALQLFCVYMICDIILFLITGRLAKPVISELSPNNSTIAFAEQAVLQCVVISDLQPEMKVRACLKGQGHTNLAIRETITLF